MESSPGSPDSSCPDYYSYNANLGLTNRNQSLSSVDIVSSNSGNSVSSTFQIPCQNNLGNDEIFQPTLESSSRGQSYYNNSENVSNFQVGSQWHGSHSVRDNVSGLSSSENYQSSALSSGTGIDNFYKTTTEQVNPSHNPPPYSKPEMPYFASTSTSMLAASKTTPKIVPFPEIGNSNYISDPSSRASARQRKTNILGNQTIPNSTQIPRSFPQSNLQRHDTSWSLNNAPRHHLSSYNANPQPTKSSAKSSYVEKSLKRKLHTVINRSDCLLSAPSSSSSYVDKKPSISNVTKKQKHNRSPNNIDDDEVQIIMPETSKSHAVASGSSLSTACYRKPSAILGNGRLISSNSSNQLKSEHNYNQLLDSQMPRQTSQDRSSTIHYPLSREELEQVLSSVWSDLDEIASSTDITSTAGSPPGTENEESSSSSIISIHDVVEGTNSFEMTKPPSPLLEKVPSDLPSLITLHTSPNISEKVKIKQEVENVKEDFKRLIEDELICNICTEVLIKPITLGCSHTFCKFCISQWKEKKKQCPMCRANIETETPCLFLDNFISKAVEQLDPASVEKRLEIIKSREEQQKKKIYKPPVQLSQHVSQTFSPLQNSGIVDYTLPIRPIQQRRQTSEAHLRRSIMFNQVLNRYVSPENMHHQSSNIPQISSHIPQISSVSQRLGVAQQPVHIPQPFLNLHHQPNSFDQYFY